MNNDTSEELIAQERDWGKAMVLNDADAIGRFMADTWTIIGPEGSVCDRARFLDLVRSDVLSHNVMDFDAAPDLQVRVYGDAAVLTFRAVSGGHYQGQPFRTVERVSDVWIRCDAQWRCVHTHLSRIDDGNQRGSGSAQ